jgi:NAD(P)-dependent dehydrogenase (short-subunit alcohol dehydrogenase family)
MTSIAGKVAVVTGAGSGIGRALAIELTGRGAHVALSDVNDAGLAETAALLAGSATTVTTHRVDVRDWDAMQRHAADVKASHGGADIIINNAGLSVRASVEEMPYEDFKLVIDVNLWGVVHGTKAFFPLFRERGAGHIVNISSINGMVPFHKNGPYNVSKYAVYGLNETLMQELAGDTIKVTSVHPGGIQTNIAHNAKGVSADEAAFFNKLARTTAQQAAVTILRAVEKDRQKVFVGADAKIMAAAKRLMPAWTVKLVGKASKAPVRR